MIPPDVWVPVKGVPVVCKRNVKGLFGVSEDVRPIDSA
jgi:hypothetical protein